MKLSGAGSDDASASSGAAAIEKTDKDDTKRIGTSSSTSTDPDAFYSRSTSELSLLGIIKGAALHVLRLYVIPLTIFKQKSFPLTCSQCLIFSIQLRRLT